MRNVQSMNFSKKSKLGNKQGKRMKTQRYSDQSYQCAEVSAAAATGRRSTGVSSGPRPPLALLSILTVAWKVKKVRIKAGAYLEFTTYL